MTDIVGQALWLASGQDDPHSVTIAELCDEIIWLRSERDRLRSVMLDMFENPQFQVAIGGNPNMVDRLMARARAALSPLEQEGQDEGF